MRIGFAHTIGETFKNTIKGIVEGKIPSYQTNDKSQLKLAIDGINRIIKEGDKKIFYNQIEKNYRGDIETQAMHDDCGIVSFSQEGTINIYPYWHRIPKNRTLKKRKFNIHPIDFQFYTRTEI